LERIFLSDVGIYFQEGRYRNKSQQIKLNIEQIRKIELDILLNIVKFCETYNLRYFLAGGTLLGAIRHKGFIPWDDDIDIFMPRPDYEKFISLFEKFRKNENLLLVAPGKSRNKGSLIISYIKVLDKRTIKYESGLFKATGGIDVDIFPIDGLPEGMLVCKWHFFVLKILYITAFFWFPMDYYYIKNDFKRAIVIIGSFFFKLLGRGFSEYMMGLINKRGKRYEFERSEFVGQSVFPHYGIRERNEKKCFSDHIEVEFEGHFFKGPILFDKYLSQLFGDYLKLPPEAERITHHIDAFWKCGYSQTE